MRVAFLISLITLLAISFTIQYVLASDFSNSIFYSGALSFNINKSYSSGDILKTEIQVANFEDFPIANAHIVVDIVQGCKYPVYPSQKSDCDNIFYEKIIRNVNLPANGYKKVEFSYRLPESLKSGTYRMDVFLLTDRTPIVGIPYIHLPGEYYAFELSGNSSALSPPKILRTKTQFMSETGPVGVGVEPNSKVMGTVYISSEDLRKVELSLDLCEWDDTSCGSFLIEKRYSVNLSSGENKIDVSFKAPEKPDAYALRLELKDMKGNTLSLYRSRVVVKGKTAKIRKLTVSKSFFKSGEEGKIYLLVGTSPDHYTKPVIKNVKAIVTLKDLLSGEKVFEASKIVPKLSINENIILKDLTFDFKTKKELKKFEICSDLISSKGEKYDEYCYDINSNNFLHGKNFTLSWKYISKTLTTTICATDNYGMPISTNAEMLLIGNNKWREKQIKIKNCSRVIFKPIESGIYKVLIDSKGTEQYEFYLNLTENNTLTHEKQKRDEGISFLGAKIIFYVVLIIIIIAATIYVIKEKRPQGL